jgi:hypothetical protein
MAVLLTIWDIFEKCPKLEWEIVLSHYRRLFLQIATQIDGWTCVTPWFHQFQMRDIECDEHCADMLQ